MRAVAFAALAAGLSLSAAAAQEAAPPQDVCLTNACSTAPKFASVGEAIRAGHGVAVRDMGGTPAQVMDALRRRLEARIANERDESMRRSLGLGLESLIRFADLSGGAQLRFGAGNGSRTQQGVAVVGAVERVDPAGKVDQLMLLEDGGGLVTVATVQIPKPQRPPGQ